MTGILGIIIIALILWIIFQLSSANEYVSDIKGNESGKDETSSDRINAWLSILFMIIGLIAIVWSAFYYAPMYLPAPASEHGMWIRSMFQWTLVPTGIVFVLTQILLFWFAFKYRYNKKRRAVHFAHSTKLEIIWTAIPAVVMIALVAIGLVNWFKIFKPAPENAIVVEATAKQFQWDLRYAGTDNQLGSKSVYNIDAENSFGIDWKDKNSRDDFKSDTLYLIKDVPVLVKINSIDVLHSFYLPHFRVKMDAVPGIPTQFHFLPTKTTKEAREEYDNRKFNYELACAELCGQAHFNMRRVVKVVEQDEWDEWWDRQQSLYSQLTPEQQMKAELKASNVLKIETEIDKNTAAGL